MDNVIITHAPTRDTLLLTTGAIKELDDTVEGLKLLHNLSEIMVEHHPTESLESLSEGIKLVIDVLAAKAEGKREAQMAIIKDNHPDLRGYHFAMEVDKRPTSPATVTVVDLKPCPNCAALAVEH